MKPETKEVLLKLEKTVENMSESQQAIFTELAPLVTENESIFENLIEKINEEKNRVMPEVLAEKLKTIRNNPLEEPKLHKIQEELSKKLLAGEISNEDALLDLLEGVYTIEDLDAMPNLNIKDLLTFAGAVSNKVFLFTYEDEKKNEITKEIPSQNELLPLTYTNKKVIREMLKSNQKVISAIQKSYRNAQTMTEEELNKSSEDIKAYTEQLEEQKKKVLGMCNLDVSSMSDWEKNLLYKKLIDNANGSYTPPVGKR